MGIFVLVLLMILLGCLFYLILKTCDQRIKIIRITKEMLYKKLFYSSFLRYMIVSNMELTTTVWAFFIYSYGFDTFEYHFYTVCYLVAIIFLLVYPFFTMYFLLKN